MSSLRSLKNSEYIIDLMTILMSASLFTLSGDRDFIDSLFPKHFRDLCYFLLPVTYVVSQPHRHKHVIFVTSNLLQFVTKNISEA